MSQKKLRILIAEGHADEAAAAFSAALKRAP
jgi:hypothetical protein